MIDVFMSINPLHSTENTHVWNIALFFVTKKFWVFIVFVSSSFSNIFFFFLTIIFVNLNWKIFIRRNKEFKLFICSIKREYFWVNHQLGFFCHAIIRSAVWLSLFQFKFQRVKSWIAYLNENWSEIKITFLFYFYHVNRLRSYKHQLQTAHYNDKYKCATYTHTHTLY